MKNTNDAGVRTEFLDVDAETLTDELPLDAPFLGEHNREILRDYLALDDARLAELEENNVLTAEPVLS